MPKKQQKESSLRSFMKFLYNSENKTCMGRSGNSWAKITVFYIIFYACLMGFWFLCLTIFLQTVDYREPKWNTNTGSRIGQNPGLGFRPRPPAKSVESTLIWFTHGRGENWGHWVKELTNITDTLEKGEDNAGNQYKDCDYDDLPGDDQFCSFKVGALGTRCTKEQKFGYQEGQPCIFIKLNKIYNWMPKPYDTVDDLPDNMPENVKTIIEEKYTDGGPNITKQNVWISCEGENPADIENVGQINYYPDPVLPFYYFPFTNVQGYQSPMVAVEFQGVQKGVLINIECKAWAKNIKHDRKERRGSVHFELMVD